MRSVVQSDSNGEIAVVELPRPLLGHGGVIVRNEWSVISSGTERATRELARANILSKARARPAEFAKLVDVARHEGLESARSKALGKLAAWRHVGYSSAGVVIEVGDRCVGKFAVGDRVACAGVGYATHSEIVFVPAHLCAHIPNEVDAESAAYTTLGAIALHGIRQSEVQIGDKVAVIGLGVIGQLTVQLLKASGCQVTGFDIDPPRRAIAERLTGVLCTDPRAMPTGANLPPGGEFDVAIVTAATSSNAPIELATLLCRDRGRVVALGDVPLRLSRERFYRKELDLRLSRSYGPGRYDPTYEEKGVDYPIGYVRWTEQRNLAAFLNLLQSGSVRPKDLTTHRFAITKAAEAYDLVAGRAAEPFLGVVFQFDDSPSEPRRIEVRVRHGARGSGIGVVGAGSFASTVVLPRLVNSGLELNGIASASGLSANVAAKRFGFRYVGASAEDVISDDKTAAVMILTRHEEHASLVERAVIADKYVFVEKPLCVTPAELTRLASMQQMQPRVLVGFNRRFSSHGERIRDHFSQRSEPLMLLIRVNAGFVDRSHWTQESMQGGRIIGEGCHFVDLMRFIVGSPIRVVSAAVLPDSGRYTGDNVVAVLHFADGSIGTLVYQANGSTALDKEYVEVHGAGKSAVCRDFRITETFVGGKSRETFKTRGQDKGHAAEIAHFVSAVKSGSMFASSYEEVLETTAVTFAIVESMRSGVPSEVARFLDETRSDP